MADNIMDAFLLWIDENDDARQALEERIISYPGAKEEITEKVLIPFAAEHGFIISMEDVELYNGHENDGSEVPPHLR